ncbi:hypothetical protein CE91St41_13520 [Oscillospiraceae bacterium]|nr:hypothetical protein CE91St40_24020 [Oscillospiraceae bacterium]BDF74463.1 hypothetical protein CE91St41_13520 [Oscillospiraceae bacterium]
MEKCGISEKTAKKCAALWVEQIESWKYLMYDVLYPDARETLEQLSRRVGLQLALVTARSREQLMFQQLQELGIRDFFTRVYCVDPRSAKEKKLKAAREIESVVLWVGDTEVDQYAAEQINCPFYALNRGFRDFTYWEKVNIPAHANLLPLLKQDKEW